MKRVQSRLPQPEQLPSGRWRCRVLIDGSRVSFTADDPLTAQQKAMAAKSGAAPQAKKIAPSGKTLGEAMDDYMEMLEHTLSPSTLRGYKSVRENRVPSLIDKPIKDITQAMYQKALDIEKKQLSPKTVRNIWGLIHAVLQQEGIEPPEIKLPQKITNTRPFLDDQQLRLFLVEIRDDPAEIPLLLALHSLRRSEIMGLRWQDIDLAAGTIHIAGAMVHDTTGAMVRKSETKNTSSRRYVRIIIPRLQDLLEAVPDKHGQVVTMPELTIYKHANYACRRAELPEVGIHGLRHTFASLCFFLGIPEKAIMEMGGWSDPTVLRNIYTHLSARQEEAHTAQLRSFFTP